LGLAGSPKDGIHEYESRPELVERCSMNRSINKMATALFLASFGILAGCATQGRDLVRSDTIKLEMVPSALGTIGAVTVIQEGEEVTLRGEVKHRPGGRGFIPGHIDLDVIDPEDNVLEKCVIDYYPGPKSTYANFHAVLKAPPPPGSRIRVIHNPHIISANHPVHCNGSL
jgi:hypothetical protein